jgi:hypothetical protein
MLWILLVIKSILPCVISLVLNGCLVWITILTFSFCMRAASGIPRRAILLRLITSSRGLRLFQRREIFYLNADVVDLDDPYILGTMAHEFQLVILGYQDPDEELWLNEGFSELAAWLNGYDPGGFDYFFSKYPDTQLTDWSEDSWVNDINYGASFLFTTYFYERFGDSLTRAWVSNPLNGFASLDQVFVDNGVPDELTEQPYSALEFFRDWSVANIVNDPTLGDGRYAYKSYTSLPQFDVTDWFYDCDDFLHQATVSQFGSDYIQIACDKPSNFSYQALRWHRFCRMVSRMIPGLCGQTVETTQIAHSRAHSISAAFPARPP